MSDASVTNKLEAISSFASCCVSLKWKMKNFLLYCVNESAPVDSPPFSCSDATWVLQIYPDETIGIVILVKTSDWESKKVNYKISVQDKNGTDHYATENECIFAGSRKWSDIIYLDTDWTSLINEKEKFLPDDTVTICCELKYISDAMHSSVTSFETSEHKDGKEVGAKKKIDGKTNDDSEVKGLDRLAENFKRLLHDGYNSDALLKAGDREFPVHRGILSARSPVFFSMFHHDMAEKSSGVVDIPDCKAAAFDVLLLYLYTGSADTLSTENVYNLYYAADKYQVNDLKEECVCYMKQNLSVDTFCDVITLALQHNESDLIKGATHFFCGNVKKIIKTVKWQTYLKDYSTSANELYIKAMNA